MTDDIALLRQFVAGHAEPAFRELVRQRIDFVYATALRQVHGDRHLAEEVAQSVFLDLARKARELSARPNLTGWFYTSTRFAAAKALRSRMRRLNHETGAHAMQEILSASSPSEIAWNELRPVLDTAMHELNAEDREAILLRYFENRPLADVGRAIGLAENSARMRVDRAVEKLRARLARRGITSTAAALSAALMAQPAVLAPAGLAASVAETTLGSLALGGAAVKLWFAEFFSRQALTAAAVTALAGVGAYFAAAARADAQVAAATRVQEQALAQLRRENGELHGQNQRIAREQAAVRPATTVVDPLDRLRALAALIREGTIGRLTWRSPSPQAASNIVPGLVDLFALKTDEAQRLSEAAETARREIVALAIAQSTVERTEHQVIIHLPAVAGGRESHERMVGQMRHVLGEERYALCQEIGVASAFEQALNSVGLVANVITVVHEPAPRNPQYPYSYSRSRVLPGRGGGGGGGGGGADFESLKRNLGPFAVFVPADF